VTTPTSEVYKIAFRCEHDDIDDDPVHSIIVSGKDVYQSYCNLYPLRRTHIPNLYDLLRDPKNNWSQLTNDLVSLEFSVIIQYSQPKTLNLPNINMKYEQLQCMKYESDHQRQRRSI
jgi:hypothetical protein